MRDHGPPVTLRAVAVMAVIGLVAGCGEDEKPAAAQSQSGPMPTVVVRPVEIEDVPVVREFVARTEARDTIVVTARVEAVLDTMEFVEGEPVKKDQVLYRLDSETYDANLSAAQARDAKAQADLKLAEEQVSVREAEAALLQAEAKLKKAEQDVARLRPLAEQDAVPRQDLDTALAAEEVAQAEVEAREATLKNAKIMEEVGVMQAKAQVQSAQADVKLAELDLEYCTIRSPIDGLIGRTKVDIGNLVGRGSATELVEVSTVDPMWVTMAISEAEYLEMVGRKRSDERDKIQVELILADDSVYGQIGKFITADRAVSIETGTLQIVAEFPNPDGELRPGQFARVRTAVALLNNAVVVPQRAVMEQQSAKVVLVVESDGTVALRTVQLSHRHEDKYVVVDGLSGGEQVIIEGQMKARPGMKVKTTQNAVSEEPAAAEHGHGGE